MNDLKIRPVKITLDRERNLIMDLNAYEELENIYENEPPIYTTEISIDDFGRETVTQTEVVSLVGKAFQYLSSSRKKIKHIKNFLFAGLVHEDHTLTPERIGTMIGAMNISELTDHIWKAVEQSTPEPKEGSEASTGE